MKLKWLSLNWLIVGPKTKFVALATSLLFVLVLQGHAHAQSSQIQGPRDNAQVYSGVVYGPIDQNDTLWRIASRYKQDSQFSVYQVMLAIYELNQQAFENGNFNTMVNGATLRLPSDRYIARMDVQAGRAKAERDDRAFGRQNSVRNTNPQNTAQTPSSAPPQTNQANLKPEVPLVNQEDLSKTQSQLQNQLNGLRRQQQEQFVALKNQVAASINSVEILLDENRKLNDRLQQIDDNNRNLTTKVETELQVQIDQQVEQLNQLIELITDAEQRRIDEESKSIMSILSSNTAIILMSVGFTLLALIGFGIFLLRKTGPKSDAVIQTGNNAKKSDDIVDDDLVIGELDDETDQDSDDLLAALEQDANTQDDDILSDELEDDDVLAALDDDDLGGGFDIDDELGPEADENTDSAGDDFDGLDDDMLVPDSPASEKKEGQEKTTEELDFDEISLDDDEDSAEGISLDEEADVDLASTQTNEEIDLSGDDTDTTIEPQTPDEGNPNPFDESIEASDDGTPEDISLDENGEIDEDTLDQIEQKIEEKDQTINKLADELIEELDSGDQEGSDNGEDELKSSEDSPEDETVSSEIDDDSELDGDAQTTLEEGDAETVDLSASTESASLDNADVESLMDGLDDVIDIDNDDSTLDDDNTDLSNELLSELEQDSEVQDELDALLADEDLIEPEPTEDGGLATDDQVGSELDETILDLSGGESELDSVTEDDAIDLSDASDDISDTGADDQVLSDDVSALADELLEELESDGEDSDELDSLLDELDEEPDQQNGDLLGQTDDILEPVDESVVDEISTAPASLDADDLLDDIPSFTSEISGEDNPTEEAIAEEFVPEEVIPEEVIPEEVIPEETMPVKNSAETSSAEESTHESSQSEKESSDEPEQPKPEKQELSQEDKTTTDSPKSSLDALVDGDESDEDQDVLSGLPDLDGWLDEEEPQPSSADASKQDGFTGNVEEAPGEDIDSGLDLSALELDDIDIDGEQNIGSESADKLGLDNEDELLEGLDNADFDDMLNDLADDETSQANDPLAQAGLDIEALMTEEDKSGIAGSDEDSSRSVESINDIDDAFVDVDDLLKESDAMPEMQDDDLDLDLENSLDKLVLGGDEANSETISDDENDQASNLDLAQVYIDMEDFEAAQELLDEVTRKGNEQQKTEAASLLGSFT